MTRYAADTTVPAGRSKTEIEGLLRKHGADQFGTAEDHVGHQALVWFCSRGVNFKLPLRLPKLDDDEVRFTPSGRVRTKSQQEAALEQEIRRRWRALAMTLRAMFVGVAEGVFAFEQIFMPYAVWADGQTTWQTLQPVLTDALARKVPLPAIQDAPRLLTAEGKDTG